MLLRTGNAGSNTFTDHKEVLDRALKQVPAAFRRKVIVRIDGAGASHKLIEHMLALFTKRKTLLFTCGWMITESDRMAVERRVHHLLEQVLRPPRAQLTSANRPDETEGDTSRPGGSRRRPGHTGQYRTPPETDMQLKNRPQHEQ